MIADTSSLWVLVAFPIAPTTATSPSPVLCARAMAVRLRNRASSARNARTELREVVHVGDGGPHVRPGCLSLPGPPQSTARIATATAPRRLISRPPRTSLLPIRAIASSDRGFRVVADDRPSLPPLSSWRRLCPSSSRGRYPWGLRASTLAGTGSGTRPALRMPQVRARPHPSRGTLGTTSSGIPRKLSLARPARAILLSPHVAALRRGAMWYIFVDRTLSAGQGHPPGKGGAGAHTTGRSARTHC